MRKLYSRNRRMVHSLDMNATLAIVPQDRTTRLNVCLEIGPVRGSSSDANQVGPFYSIPSYTLSTDNSCWMRKVAELIYVAKSAGNLDSPLRNRSNDEIPNYLAPRFFKIPNNFRKPFVRKIPSILYKETAMLQWSFLYIVTVEWGLRAMLYYLRVAFVQFEKP